MSTSITRAIADAVSEVAEYRTYVDDKSIKSVEFRRGLAEIDVVYEVTNEWDEGRESTETATIPAEDILSALLQKVVDDEHARDTLANAILDRTD